MEATAMDLRRNLKAVFKALERNETVKILYRGQVKGILSPVRPGKLKVADKSRRPTEVTARLISEVLLVPDFLLEPPADQVTKYTERAGAVQVVHRPVHIIATLPGVPAAELLKHPRADHAREIILADAEKPLIAPAHRPVGCAFTSGQDNPRDGVHHPFP